MSNPQLPYFWPTLPCRVCGTALRISFDEWAKYHADRAYRPRCLGCWLAAVAQRLKATFRYRGDGAEEDMGKCLTCEAAMREQREEEEASVCPEDFGFVEYIKLLEGKIMQAEVHLREPQTSATCQTVPPHPRACLVGTLGWPSTGQPKPQECVVCEAVKQAVVAAIRDVTVLCRAAGGEEEIPEGGYRSVGQAATHLAALVQIMARHAALREAECLFEETSDPAIKVRRLREEKK